MPYGLKSASNGFIEIVLVRNLESPQYEVRLYTFDAPYEHWTLISTDSLNDAEKIYRAWVIRM